MLIHSSSGKMLGSTGSETCLAAKHLWSQIREMFFHSNTNTKKAKKILERWYMHICFWNNQVNCNDQTNLYDFCLQLYTYTNISQIYSENVFKIFDLFITYF